MGGRSFFVALVIVSFLAGYPYAALILNRILGTNTSTLLEHDGRHSVLTMGPNAPRPDWVPMMPRAWVITTAH